jgi:hypothetical protein
MTLFTLHKVETPKIWPAERASQPIMLQETAQQRGFAW